ncbi:MAG: hypothetical protein JSU65_07650 [Candidatus Zixiibacteriota bacterium]|nr:MAG: hypothetical protein JSU65_07650 [candidate division Zixibacteria bacterium]
MTFVNVIAVLGYISTLVYIFKKYPWSFPIFAYLSLPQLWALVSCFYNDLGVYNFELFRYTVPSLATTRLAIFYVIFNAGFILLARLLERHHLVKRDYRLKDITLQLGYFKLMAYVLIGTAILFLYYKLSADGIPALMGVARHRYLEEAGPLAHILLNYGALIAFALGLFRRSRGRFSVNGIVFLAIFVYAIAVGHKSSHLMLITTAYFTPIFIRYLAGQSTFSLFRPKYMLAGLVAAMLVVGFAFATYYYVSRDHTFARTLLIDRIFAGQGEIWWAVDQMGESLNGAYDPGHWQDELDYILSPGTTPAEDVGMRYLMVRILGPEKAYAIFDAGVMYTMAYPAILIATFPYPVAILIQFLAGMVMALMLYYLRYCLIYRHHLRSLVMILVVFPYVAMLFTGNFYVFFTLGMAVKIGILIGAETGFFGLMPSTAQPRGSDSLPA